MKIYRGPHHDLQHLPQFAPDDNVYEYLPEANLDEYIKMNKDIKIIEESRLGLAKCIFSLYFRNSRQRLLIRQILRKIF